MKKFYAFVAAALMSASLFAAPASVPAVSDLASKYDLANNVVLCFYFDAEPCNTVVLAGSYNGWSDDPSKCVEFEALDGFAGWYVAEAKYEAGFMAKPLQLDGSGSFAGWAYQAGEPAAWVNLGVEGTKEIQLTGEGDHETKAEYPQGAGAYIYELKYWKKEANPCTAKYHNYTLYLFPPECEAKEDIFEPAINSPMSGSWKMEAMELTVYEGEVSELFGEICYVYQANHVAEGTAYKFVDKTFGWDNQYQMWDAESESWKNVTDADYTLPESDKDYVELVYDWRDGNKYRYPMCDAVIFDVDIAIKVPAGAPEAGVELMGSFIGGNDFGTPVTMQLKDGKYTAKVQGIEKSTFKLREAGTWSNQVQIWDGEKFVDNEANWQFGEEWEDVLGCETCKLIDLDWSNGDPETGDDAYKWTNYDPDVQGIQNVRLTENAHKVVVDGVLYIVRDNKMFNLQGAQIR